MKNLTLYKIAEACGGKLYNYNREADREVSGVVLDSRLIEENFLFVATKGEQADGHDFIAQVMEKGAAGVICEKEPASAAGPYILVEDSFQALKDIAEFYRQQLKIKIVGITGSVGKTSTKEAIASVLSVRYNVLKTEGNYNNEVGLPLTVLRIRDNHEAAVLEMGISDFGEMHRLSKIARPDICVLTNIGECHLEQLKSREGVLKAKTEIFDFMKEDGVVCANGDDDMLLRIEEIRGRKPLYFGLSKSNKIYADEVENKGLFGSHVKLHMEGTSFAADIPLPGGHMIYNALAAACVGSLLGLDAKDIREGIHRMEPVGGRSNIIRLPDKVIIDDCYNANPVSMCAALDLLSDALTRTVAVMGDMFELGEDKEWMHAKVGSYAVEKGIDVVVCIGELSRHMYESACETARNINVKTDLKEDSKVETETDAGTDLEIDCKKTKIYYFSGKKEFLERMPDILQKDDTILVKASHGMAFEEIVRGLETLAVREKR